VIARPHPLVSVATLFALFVAGCAGGGASRSVAPAVANAVAPLAAAEGGVHPAGARRTLNVPTCSGLGLDAFVGGTGGNTAGGHYSVVGGGQTDLVCDGWGVIAGGFENTVSGTGINAVDSFIGSGEYNLISTDAADDGILTGNSNQILAGRQNVIGGGENNIINGSQSAILDGQFNSIGAAATLSVVGGGQYNSVTSTYGFIGAGTNNTVSGAGAYIAAGGYNTASGEGAVVVGGFEQTASGVFSTIPGGYENTAAGTYSFAAGERASAPYTGDFVWSDGSDGTKVLTATKAYQFLARASGGVIFATNTAGTVGAALSPGSGTWGSFSDRNAKTDIMPLDSAAVLDKVDALPISRWSYKSEHGVRHVGPMAQDFYAAFKVGPDDRHITSIDEDGVALAAIKALHADNRALHADNRALHADNRALHADNGRLRAANGQLRRHVASLEARVGAQLTVLRAEVESLRQH
jgi:hypothetical protein